MRFRSMFRVPKPLTVILWLVKVALFLHAFILRKLLLSSHIHIDSLQRGNVSQTNQINQVNQSLG